MAKLVINSYEEFASHLGEKLGESDWLPFTPKVLLAMINSQLTNREKTKTILTNATETNKNAPAAWLMISTTMSSARFWEPLPATIPSCWFCVKE